MFLLPLAIPEGLDVTVPAVADIGINEPVYLNDRKEAVPANHDPIGWGSLMGVNLEYSALLIHPDLHLFIEVQRSGRNLNFMVHDYDPHLNRMVSATPVTTTSSIAHIAENSASSMAMSYFEEHDRYLITITTDRLWEVVHTIRCMPRSLDNC